jgi:hypothetical protein
MRKEIKQVEKIVKKELEPLINKLMAYFDGEVNYTLAGYVSKILSFFFTKKPADVPISSLSSSDTFFKKTSLKRCSNTLNLDQ